MCASSTTLRLALVSCLLVCGSLTRAAAQEPAQQLSLQVGEQRVLPAENVQSYSEGSRGVVDVRLTRDGKNFVIVGQQAGVTTLLLIMEEGDKRLIRIEVTPLPSSEQDRTKVSGDTGEAPDSVDPRDNIRLDFYFVQFDKSYSHDIGIDWPAAIGGASFNAAFDVISSRFTSATAVVAEQPLPQLDMAQSVGWAKIMRRAAVITANGEQASFSGGGEVNIAIAGSLAAEIRTIPFGSTITVLPHYDRSTGRIELRVKADISDLTDDQGTGAPGRTTSTLDTLVNLELGQSLMLAGLTSKSENHSKSGLPGLSQIPILGALFGSDSENTKATENVVFIVPTVVDAVSRGARQLIDDALHAYDEYDGDLEDWTLGTQGAGHDR